MANLDFPASPNNGDTYTVGTRSWRWNSTLLAWEGGAAAVTKASLDLAGTNTGDETAARIATALNAGTQDTTAADTDRLAVTTPAGGWMLLSTLWTWILAKITANQSTTRTALGGGVAGQAVFGAETAQAGRVALASAPVASAGTTYALALVDNQQYLRLTSATGCVITLPTQASVAWPDGTTIMIRRATGAGALSWSAVGVTINNDAISSISAGQVFAIRRVASNVWDFI